MPRRGAETASDVDDAGAHHCADGADGKLIEGKTNNRAYWSPLLPLVRMSSASEIAVRRSASPAAAKASSCMLRIHVWSAGGARSSAAVIIARPRTTLPLW